MKKPQSKQRLTELKRKACVKIAKDIAKHKAGYHCEFVDENGVRCHRKAENGYQMHGSHIKCEASHKSMSANPENLQCHCAGHHTGMGNVTPNWHKDPLLMIMLFAKQQPDRARRLNIEAQATKHCDLYFWTTKLAELKNELSNLNKRLMN